MRCSVSGLCNGLGKGVRHGASRDCSSGFRHLERDWQWDFPVAGLRSGPGKGLGNGATWCDSRLHFPVACPLFRVWQGASLHCQTRLQFRSEASGTGLARGVATVPRATTVQASGLCRGLGKGGGHGATRDYSSGFRPLETGLARGFATVPTVTTVPVTVLCNGPRDGLGRGANHDYSSGHSSL